MERIKRFRAACGEDFFQELAKENSLREFENLKNVIKKFILWSLVAILLRETDNPENYYAMYTI